MKNYKSMIVLFLITSLFLGISGCKAGKKKQFYKEIKFRPGAIEFNSKYITTTSVIRVNNQVFISTTDDIWVLDFEKKTERQIIKSGMGPDQIFSPYRIHNYSNRLWVNSLLGSRSIYSFSPEPDNPQVQTKNFINATKRIDDFMFISDNVLAMAFVSWPDADLLQLYDFNTGKYKKFGEATQIELMMRFNISRASLALIGNKAYITQSIVPEIQVIPIDKNGRGIEKIALTPPFYKPHPKDYIKNKYDHKAHLEWMASWTSVSDIKSSDDWLLVVYKYGYEPKYCYELFSINDLEHRYYITDTVSYIYNFRVIKNKVEFEVYDRLDEEVIWKKAESYLY